MLGRTGPASLFVAAFIISMSLWPAVPSGAADDDCFDCHGADGAAVEDDGRYAVDRQAWEASVHGDMGCDNCHFGVDDYPHDNAGREDCGECHEDAAERFALSLHKHYIDTHGEDSVWPRGDPCAACHGLHDTRSVDDEQSRVYFRNIPSTCGACHGDLAMVTAEGLSTAPFDNFKQSVHGLANGNGESTAAVCTSCHGSHLLVRGNDPNSRINPFNLPKTCGQCHPEQTEHYLESVHGTAFAKGVSAAPTCADCHGTHSIKHLSSDSESQLRSRMVRSTCPACHASEALVGEYGPNPERVASYQASYHGLALKRGAVAVADCSSCHGIHAIYPSDDPRSKVAAANLAETCGSCHPGAGEAFVKNPVHFDPEARSGTGSLIVAWVTTIYWVLIIVVIGSMLLHNAIIVTHYIRRKARRERAGPRVRRFSTSQTLQHGLLVLSFCCLALTGFALAYPDIWWSRGLSKLGMSEDLRRTIHRSAAVIMIAISIYHVMWSLLTAYGRAELARIWPRAKDLREMIDNLRFHLGLIDHPLPAGKYDYPAKMEYWALVWGTIVMALTGLVLWFPVEASNLLPYWATKVSEVIHLFEAWLASLAILVFHLFYVVGHPDVYPINLAMFSGKMTEEDAEHHHPLWLEEARGSDSTTVSGRARSWSEQHSQDRWG